MNHLPKQDSVEIVIFEAAGQRFGVRSAFVRQIVRAATLAAAPNPRPGVMGLLNLRGQSVPVFDARSLLPVADAPLEHSDHLIVMQIGDRPLALRAARAEGLVKLREREIDTTGGAFASGGAIEGIASVDERLVLLLDPGKLLASQYQPEAQARANRIV